MDLAPVFPHHDYYDRPPRAAYELLRALPGPSPDDSEFAQQMAVLGNHLRQAQVAAMYLVHGTFVGRDLLGIFGELGRFGPKLGKDLGDLVAQLIAHFTGDAGNYTWAYAKLLCGAINPPGCTRLPVRLFRWSGENHHLGRADGAIRLLAELADRWPAGDGRLLLWGHSHGGNILAIVSNLLGGDRSAVARFFEATEVFWRAPFRKTVDLPDWDRVRRMLMGELPCPIDPKRLDFVTLGTPVRYGWNPEGFSRLLHFIHRRPAPGLPEYRAPFPPQWRRVAEGADGDYIQQLGIAGTDFIANPILIRAYLANRRLRVVLGEADAEPRGMLDRFRAGRIVPDHGLALLVDYGRKPVASLRQMAGHGVYTRRRWMLFHLAQTVERFYAPVESIAGATDGKTGMPPADRRRNQLAPQSTALKQPHAADGSEGRLW